MKTDTVLVTILEESGGYWYPRVFDPRELATYLHGRETYEPGEQFRVWDIDANGQLHECEVQSESTGYDQNDWATVAVRVVRADTKEFVVGTGYRMDGRA